MWRDESGGTLSVHTREVRNTHKLLVSHINAIRASFPMLEPFGECLRPVCGVV